MGNIYSIGKSALMAANYGISVTGHNISNASTPGYNRQVVLQSNNSGQKFGFGFVGDGVQLDDIRRVYDEMLGKQFVETQAESSRLGTYYNQISKINNKLADASAGVSPALQDFFSAVQEVASLPTSVATREAMLSDSQILAGRFNNLSKQMTEQRDLVNANMRNSVELINTYANDIAKLNEQISRAQVTVGNPAPNDLLDQRDLLISKLSQEIGVKTVKNGLNLDVYVGNGQPLVIDSQAFQMYADPSAKDPQRMEIGYIHNGQKIEIPDKLLAGGNLKGYIDFRDNELDPVLNELGRVAINLAWDFNDQHKLGQDLNGNMGQDYFGYTTKYSVSAPSGSGAAVSTNIVDRKALVSSNYTVEYMGSGSFQVTRQSDGKVFNNGSTLPDSSIWNGSFPVTIDGVEFSAQGTASMVVGDTMVLKPLNGVAESLKVLISDPNEIAAALSIRTGKGASNLGTGIISPGELTAFNNPGAAVPSVPPNLNMTVSEDTAGVKWIAPNRTVTVTYADGTTGTYDSPNKFRYEEGMQISLGDFNFNITGTIEAGDTFFIEPNTGGTGDNRNMLALAALQDAKTMGNGTATYQGVYSQMVNRVGSKTRELGIMNTSTANLLTSIYEEQQSQSGVNLDEEAINLMRYQQNYNAASKVIQTANELFDAILAIF